MKNKLFLLVLLSAGVLFANAQTKDELQKKESDLKKEITELTNSLTQIQKSKKLSLSQVASVQRKIAAREELINTISKQVKLLDETIYQNELDIYRMGKELDTLKQKYAQSIVFAYKNRSSYQYLNFLFSATSFNDALKRVTYLKSYRQLRETQVDNIIKTKEVLAQKRNTLDVSKKEQGLVLQNQKGQLVDLEEDKKKQTEIVKDLKNQEKEVSVQIKKKAKQRQDMQSAILAIIRRDEAEAARKAKIAKDKEIADAKRLKDQKAKEDAIAKSNANKPATTTTVTPKPKNNDPVTGMVTTKKDDRAPSKLESTEEVKEVSINFEKGRGHLPWPVTSNTILVPFGTYGAGGKLTGVSDGIEIAMPEGSNVTCVADGKVSYVGDVGGEQAVIVKHGKYYTTYSHLSSVKVSKDQEVRSGTVLGSSGTDIDGQGSLLFMINNDKGTPLNPKLWLRGR